MLDNTPVKLILASTSPRRRQLLGLSGWMFHIIPADVDETPLPDESAQDYVLRLAETKARAVGEQARNGEIIIAADTTVADADKILGKPTDGQDAFNMLQSLRGRVHQVHTAIAAYAPKDELLFTNLASTDVPMRNYSDAEIHEYIATGDPFDKAGSYAIQHQGFKPVNHLTGCYANVVGLPLCHLERMLKKFDILPVHDLQLACQRTLQYTCTEYSKILNSPPRAYPTFRTDAQSGAEGEP